MHHRWLCSKELLYRRRRREREKCGRREKLGVSKDRAGQSALSGGLSYEQVYHANLALVDIWACSETHASTSTLYWASSRDEVREKHSLVHSSGLFHLGMKPKALKPESPGAQPGPVAMAGPRFPLFFSPGYIYISVATGSTWGAGMSSTQSGFLHSVECKQTSTVLMISVVTLHVPVPVYQCKGIEPVTWGKHLWDIHNTIFPSYQMLVTYFKRRLCC